MNKESEEYKRVREEIIRIVEQSHPACGQIKECYTKCGECGADQILSLVNGKLKADESKFTKLLEPDGVRTPMGDLFRELEDPEFRYHFVNAENQTNKEVEASILKQEKQEMCENCTFKKVALARNG